MNVILKEDIEQLFSSGEIDFTVFSGKTIFISGATGLIGYNLVCALLAANKTLSVPIHVVAMIRSKQKADRLFGSVANLEYVIGDVTHPFQYTGPVDFLIHAASQTSSIAFIENPVDVINVAFIGTTHALLFAKEKQVKGMVYLSTMEVYGAPNTEEKIDERHCVYLDTMHTRSSYPESKRICECLCASYAAQYAVPVKVIRLTQTFGPGVRYDDGRVFAEFARCVIEKRNIILHTSGTTKRNYLYTADAVAAILTVLVKGVSGEAYNAANEDTFCSIREFAELVCRECAAGQIEVEIIPEDDSKHGYAPTLSMNLDTTKLNNLGWKAHYSIGIMFKRLLASMLAEQE